jgi:hypothetical protein
MGQPELAIVIAEPTKTAEHLAIQVNLGCSRAIWAALRLISTVNYDCPIT